MVVEGRSRTVLGEGKLGHFDVVIGVGSPDRSRFVDVHATVDTGSTFSRIPRRLLEDLGIEPHDRVELDVADGRVIERQITDVPVRINDRVRVTTCILGEEGESALLGVITLEQFLLAVDTVNLRLVPIRGLAMVKRGKNYTAVMEKIDREKQYDPKEAISIVKEGSFAKFDETVEVHIRTGLDSRHADQQLRGTIVLPHGLGKSQRIVVFAEGEAARLAEQAGADAVGSDDLVKRIEEGFLDFEVALATKEMMGKVGKLGRVLGPRGLMPNPRTNTVLEPEDIAKGITEAKQGRVEFRTDRTNLIHCPIGKVSFSEEALMENFTALIAAIVREKPSGSKGQYIRTITITSTMGPGVHVDVTEALSLASSATV